MPVGAYAKKVNLERTIVAEDFLSPEEVSQIRHAENFDGIERINQPEPDETSFFVHFAGE